MLNTVRMWVGGVLLVVCIPFSAIAKIKPMATQSLKPCDAKAFHLSVVVEPAQDATAQNKLGLVVEGSSSKPKLNRARRTHVEQESEFSANDCQLWQKRSMQWLVQAGIESNSPERKTVTCVNIATVDLVLDGKSKKYKLCLADAKTDAVSFAFQKFYNGTDSLVKR